MRSQLQKNNINNKYEYYLYTKPTGSTKLLNANSNQSHIINNISKGQLIRINTLTTNYSDKRLHANRLLLRLKQQNHNSNKIIQNIKRTVKPFEQNKINTKQQNITTIKIKFTTMTTDNYQTSLNNNGKIQT